jgi:hypothetical protein
MSEVNVAEVYKTMDDLRKVSHMAHMRRAPIRIQALAAEIAIEVAQLSDYDAYLKAMEFEADECSAPLAAVYCESLASYYNGSLPRERDEKIEINLLRALVIRRMFSLAYYSLVPYDSPHEHSWDRINGGNLAWATYVEYTKREDQDN